MKIFRILDKTSTAHYATQDEKGGFHILEGDPFSGLRETAEAVEPSSFLAPIEPRQIFGIGLNYRAHAAETGKKEPEYPVIFMKNISAVCPSEAEIRLPADSYSTKVDYEGELAVVIGRDCTDATEDNALDFVLGYACANDVSARDWQKEWGGGQFCRGKSFNTFCPIGPCLVTADEVGDPQELLLQTRLNGIVVQDGETRHMILSIRRLIAFLSRSATLPAGTVILTGTPEGVGAARTPPRFLVAGDVVEVEISRIGVLRNSVV